MTIGRIAAFLHSRTAIQTSDIQTFNSISLAKTASSSSSDPPSSEQIETPPP